MGRRKSNRNTVVKVRTVFKKFVVKTKRCLHHGSVLISLTPVDGYCVPDNDGNMVEWDGAMKDSPHDPFEDVHFGGATDCPHTQPTKTLDDLEDEYEYENELRK